MAYTAISAAEVAAGKPVRQELLTKVKDNFADHESRLSSLQSALAAYRPIQFHVSGDLYRAGVQSLVLVDRISFDCTLTAGRLVLVRPGLSGTLGIDILLKRGAGSWTSIFSVKPTVAAPGTAYQVITGTLGTTALLNGDLLALSIDSAMVGCREFFAELDYQT